MRCLRYLIVALLVIGWSALALAQGPMPEVDPKVAGEAAVNALATGAIAAIMGSMGMIVVWLLRLFLLPNLSGIKLGISASVLVGALAAFASLVHNPESWLQAVLAGIGAILAAMGEWGVLKTKTATGAKMKSMVDAKTS